MRLTLKTGRESWKVTQKFFSSNRVNVTDVEKTTCGSTVRGTKYILVHQSDKSLPPGSHWLPKT